jgi:hypothetical protein
MNIVKSCEYDLVVTVKIVTKVGFILLSNFAQDDRIRMRKDILQFQK